MVVVHYYDVLGRIGIVWQSQFVFFQSRDSARAQNFVVLRHVQQVWAHFFLLDLVTG